MRELHKIIDKDIPNHRPKFDCSEIEVAGETFEMYHRNALQCVKALFGDPEFADELVFAPERHYADADQTIRLYHDMHTGKWWWNLQVCIINYISIQ